MLEYFVHIDAGDPRKSAILVLPSALVPSESNRLINALHPESAKIKARPPEPFQYDARFFA